MNDYSACVLQSGAGKRLDAWLASLYPDLSRGVVQKWIDAGATIDGRKAKPSAKLNVGQVVCWHAVFEAVVDPDRAQPIELDILYDDDDVAVIYKPAGMVMHPAAGNPDGTMLNALLHHFPSAAELPRAGIVHRLDKDTSGLVMVAKSQRAHLSLVEQLASREAGRTYDAVVTGALVAGATIDQPIARHPVDRKRQAVRSDGKPAITHYRVHERFRAHTWIRVKLETGRTHQIRVHMAHTHHVLIGDRTYGYRAGNLAKASDTFNDTLRRFPRQALHARELQFLHPADGRVMQFEREMPEDMQALIDCLRDDLQCNG